MVVAAQQRTLWGAKLGANVSRSRAASDVVRRLSLQVSST